MRNGRGVLRNGRVQVVRGEGGGVVERNIGGAYENPHTVSEWPSGGGRGRDQDPPRDLGTVTRATRIETKDKRVKKKRGNPAAAAAVGRHLYLEHATRVQRPVRLYRIDRGTPVDVPPHTIPLV